MQTEIEAKFLGIDHDAMRQKLEKLGATLQHKSRLMRRKNFQSPDGRFHEAGGWVRVRDEGDKTTLSYKQVQHRGLDGTKEVSVEVSSFDATVEFLESIGLVQTSYQETKRESWRLDGVEIELDEWPWIQPFIEVEAKTEDKLLEAVNKLGLDMNDAKHGSVEIAYQAEFDVSEVEIDSWKEITFGAVPEELAKKRRTT